MCKAQWWIIDFTDQTDRKEVLANNGPITQQQLAVNFHKDKDAPLKAGKVAISKPYVWISE